MGGKTGTTTSQVTIPPEVLQRYTAVNKLAEQTAQTPFQPYTGQFVAPLTATQQAGIAQTQAASQAAQPYFGAATQNLLGAQAAAAPALTGAGQTLAEAQQAGRGYADVAGQLYGQAGLAASPYYQAATQGTHAALQGAQPYQQAATQFGLAGAQGIDPSALNIGAYMSPYTQAVAATTQQALQQQQQQEMAGQLGNAIRSGAFGGDRAGIVAANLARQQQLGMAQAMAPIYQQGYAQALQAAQQQQGLGLSAAQANRAALQQAAQQMASLGQQGYGQQLGAAQQMAGLGQALYGQALGTGQAISGLGQQQFGQGATTAQQQAALAQQLYGMGAGTAQQLAALGTGAQQAGLQGAQATIGAGTLEQQTQQAQDTAKYQQFLQERGYPFQVAQFLANIAMGTGALSGSTTTTQQPIPFFSDRRLKDDVKQIGKTNDGMPIYSFKYKGDDATQIGLMAQDVEKKHPEAVGLAGGYKTVDYAKATEDSARPERMEGGLVPSSMGGSVYDPGAFARGGYAIGGDVIDPNDIQAILASQKQSFGPFSQAGLYGGQSGQTAGGIGGAKTYVPAASLPTPRLMTASAPATQQSSVFGQAIEGLGKASDLTQSFTGKSLYQRAGEKMGLYDSQKTPQPSQDEQKTNKSPFASADEEKSYLHRRLFQLGEKADGGVVGHYDLGGTVIDPYQTPSSESGVPKDVLEKGEEKAKGLKSPEAADRISKGPGDDIMKGLQMAKMGYDVATTVLPFFFANTGGVVPRKGYANEGYVKDIDPPSTYGTEKYDPSEDPFYSAEAPKLSAPIEIKGRSPSEGVKPANVEIPNKEDSLSRLWSKVERTESGGRQFDKEGKPLTSSAGAVGVGQILPSTGPEAAKLAGLQWDEDKFYNDENYNRALGKAYLNSMYAKFGSPQLAAAAYNAGPGRVSEALKKAEIEGKDVMSYLPLETQKYVSGIFGGGKGIQIAQADSGTKTDMVGGLGDFFQAPQTVTGEPRSWGEFASSKDFIIPLLSGLKGMAQSKSPFLGAAILEGLGTGAEAYMGLQKQEADIGQTIAQTRGIETGTYQKSLMQTPFGNFMWLADGSLMPLPDYNDAIAQGKRIPLLGRIPDNAQDVLKRYMESQGSKPQGPSNVLQQTQQTGKPPATPVGVGFDDQSIQAAKAENRKIQMGGPGAETAVANSKLYNEGVFKSANGARDASIYLGELASNLANSYQNKGMNVVGFGAEGRSAVINAANSFSRAFGGPSFGTLDTDEQVNKKLTTLLGNAQSQGAGNDTLGALQMMKDVIGGVKMTPEASSKVSSELWAQNKRNIDRDNHRALYGVQSNNVYSDANADFERTNPMEKYKKESETLQKLMLRFPDLLKDFRSGKYTAEQIDKITGVPGMSWYFIGGR